MSSDKKPETQSTSRQRFRHEAVKEDSYRSAIAGYAKGNGGPLDGVQDKISEDGSIEEIARDFPPPERFHYPLATESYQSDATGSQGAVHPLEDERSESESENESESESESENEGERVDRFDTLEPGFKEQPDVKRCDSDEVENLAAETRGISTGRIQTRHEVPKWFPRRIKQMFLVNRHGGQFKFKELDLITRYRTALERTKRRRWKTYLEAGRARWQLQKAVRRMRHRALTETFYEYRKSQYRTWKRRSIRSWVRLERLHLGIRVLDEAVNINFRQERMIYTKYLG